MPEIKKYLSKDGLENYNELLPHSATQMQEYVSDWLDEHPEATTTVQDDSITTVKLKDDSVTTPKIADEAVTTPKLSQDVYKLITGNVAKGTASGDIVSVGDAWSANPIQLVVDGRSTQDGTPTPDAPVEIVSVENPALTFAGKNLCGTITDSPNGTRITGYGINNTTRYPRLSCYLPAGAYMLSLNLRSIDAIPTYGNIRIWVRDATDGQLYDLNIRTGEKSPQSTGGGIAYTDGRYSETIPTTFTRNTVAMNIGFPVSEIIFGLYRSGAYIEYDNLQIELGSTATDYEPYEGHTVPIPLQGHALRSLPDGTKDTLTLSWLRNSTREGWAWYAPTMTQRIGQYDGMDSLNWLYSSSRLRFVANDAAVRNDGPQYSAAMSYVLCSKYKAVTHKEAYDGTVNESIGTAFYNGQNHILITDGSYDESSLDAFKQSLVDAMLLYPLATPITHSLGEVELPILPAPTCTVWSDPTTGLILTYERDLTIALEKIEQAIADS